MMFDCCSLTNFAIGIFLIGLLLYWWYNKKKYVLPPGPIGLPILGYLPFLEKESFRTFKKLGEKYGDVVGLYLGRSYTIVLNDFETVKEALNNQSFLGRPTGHFNYLPDGLGFAGYNGEEWIEQRRYTMKLLKDIGMSKIPWEIDVEAEVDDIVKIIQEQRGEPLDLIDTLSASISNNMTSIILGKRLPVGDSRRKIVDDGVAAVANAFANSGIFVCFPSLLPLLSIFGSSMYRNAFSKMKEFNKFMRYQMQQRKSIPLEQRQEEIFIDGYLHEIKRSRETNSKTFFNEKNLIGTAQSMVIGGSETSRTSLIWLFLAMVTYPETQKKIQDEIDRVLGRDGKLTWTERAKLPYTYAAIMEGQRWRTIAPENVLHKASEDTKFRGYDIPAGTHILLNTWALHQDPKYWKDPESFVPERFLMNDGSLTKNRLDSYTPFSLGRRACPGEMVALIEIFRYFTAIMQKFHIFPLEDSKPVLEGSLGATYHPCNQKLRFIPRG